MLIVLKKICEQKNVNYLKKMNTFFIPTASKNIKIQKVKFDVGLSYEDCL